MRGFSKIPPQLKWITLAAEQGDAVAQYNLGTMYAKGEGVIQDYQTAAKWFRLAAEQGYAAAQFNLGGMYHQGEGVPTNYVYAYMWFNVSASLGDKPSGERRDRLAKEMTPSQIEEAQDLASECVEKKFKGCDRRKR